LAELLANRRGAGEQARAAYDQLTKDYPNRWEVEEGRAQFAWQRRDLDGAAQHFARAVELGCKNLPSLLLYARVLGYNDQPKQESDVLRKAVNLFPDSDEANLELGASLVRTGKYGPAAAALLAVRKAGTAEESYRLFYNLAYAQYRLGDSVHARQNIAKARTYTKIPAAVADIDRLRDALDGAPSVEGVLENMECGALARLHVRTDGVVKIFVIPDPTKTVTHGANGEPIELRCGPQNPPRALRIEYQAKPLMPGIAGLVRSLEFQ
jgi:tetratricopeptide (TPR) repeat protein